MVNHLSKDEYKYRVFISYFHEDMELVERISSILQENGLQPMLDKSFASGHGFTDQIKNYITHAHVFMPVITRESITRSWIHQEIGYATALNIPVMPVCYGELPGQMISELQAVSWEMGEDWREKNRAKLSKANFDSLVRHPPRKPRPLYEVAEYQEDRTNMMVDYARRVLGLASYGHVRQKGALSSFNIPEKPINHPDWRKRYGKAKLSEYRFRLQRDERVLLEEHARKCGCSLIIDPTLPYRKFGTGARKARLNELLAFLKSMPDQLVRVAINKKMPRNSHVLIVGNWFLAESITAAMGKGYMQTIFTRYAPAIQAKLDLFDRELKELLNSQPGGPANSRRYAIDVITQILKGL
jgi:hypothetical protein